MIGYYDIVLGGIGALLIAGAIAALVFGSISMIIASLLALSLLGHAMFIRPPSGITKEVESVASNQATN